MPVPEGVRDTEAWERVTKARTQLLLSHPFWGSLHMRVPFVEDSTCQTMWINGVTQGYNPEWVKTHETLETKTGLAHEACHILLLHHLRRGNRPQGEWNICCDYAVNGILVKAGFQLPEGWLYDPQFENKSAEEIFGIRNPPKPEQPPEPSKPDDEDEKSDESEDGEDSEPGDEEDDDGEDGESDGEGEGDEEGDEGTGSKPGEGDPGRAGEVRDMPSPSGQELSQAEIDQAEADMKIAVAQAETQHESMAGELPGGLKRFIQDYINPKVPWKDVLWRFFNTTAKNDYSWKKPNRRYLHQKMWLPGMISNQLEDVIVFVDTSGSQSEKDVQQCGSEFTAILEAFPAHLWVLGIDTKVASIEEFTSDDLPVVLHLAGGGGTDFKPGFEWIEKNNIDPTCVIYLTDGECNSYPEEPPYPVLWIGTRREFKPPFGELVMMHP